MRLVWDVHFCIYFYLYENVGDDGEGGAVICLWPLAVEGQGQGRPNQQSASHLKAEELPLCQGLGRLAQVFQEGEEGRGKLCNKALFFQKP